MLRIITIVLLGAFGFVTAQPAHCALEASASAAGAHAGQSAHAAHAGTRTDDGHPDDAQHRDHESRTHDAATDCPVLTICGAAALPTLAAAFATPASVGAVHAMPLERAPSLRDLSADPPPPRTDRTL